MAVVASPAAVTDPSRVLPSGATGVPFDESAHPTMRILGLCPKCARWFDCDAWFDQSLPTPCCPGCALGPAALRYSHFDPAQAGGARITAELRLR